MPSPTEITVKQLSKLIGTPECPTLIDVRIEEDIALDPNRLPGAVRKSHSHVLDWAPAFLGQSTVVYCQKGKKISQGVRAILQHLGVRSETLAGGHFAWRDAGEPLIPDTALPLTLADKPSRWVTRHRPKIDRIACPWLIRRFVDSQAAFLFVAPSEVLAVAEKFDAIPFDMPDTFWSHRGDTCTFDTMVDEFGLRTAAMTRLAKVVRGADTNRLDLAPESAGLLAASLGLSRCYKDDGQQLAAGMQLYDALYRWARDASQETHDWLTEGRTGAA